MLEDLPKDAGWWSTGGLMVAGAVKWLWGQRKESESSRHARLDLWQKELDAQKRDYDERIAGHMKHCEDQLAKVIEDLKATSKELIHVSAESKVTRAALNLALPELARVAPQSSALMQAQDLLRGMFPVAISIPADMQASINAIDEKTGKPI